jgi:hypothetical protein
VSQVYGSNLTIRSTNHPSLLLPYLSYHILAPSLDRIGLIEILARIRIGLSSKTSARIGYDPDGLGWIRVGRDFARAGLLIIDFNQCSFTRM